MGRAEGLRADEGDRERKGDAGIGWERFDAVDWLNPIVV